MLTVFLYFQHYTDKEMVLIFSPHSQKESNHITKCFSGVFDALLFIQPLCKVYLCLWLVSKSTRKSGSVGVFLQTPFICSRVSVLGLGGITVLLYSREFRNPNCVISIPSKIQTLIFLLNWGC